MENFDSSTMLKPDSIVIINEQTFVNYYNSYFRLLYLHALRMLDDSDEAKDIVQEVFTKIWNKRVDIHIKESMRAYLYKAVRNAVLDKLTSKSISKKHEEYILKTADIQTEFEDEAKLEKDLAAIIDSEIERLPTQMRLIFQLSRLEQKSHKEIANNLNISPNTVKTQISRALKVLKLRITYLFF